MKQRRKKTEVSAPPAPSLLAQEPEAPRPSPIVSARLPPPERQIPEQREVVHLVGAARKLADAVAPAFEAPLLSNVNLPRQVATEGPAPIIALTHAEREAEYLAANPPPPLPKPALVMPESLQRAIEDDIGRVFGDDHWRDAVSRCLAPPSPEAAMRLTLSNIDLMQALITFLIFRCNVPAGELREYLALCAKTRADTDFPERAIVTRAFAKSVQQIGDAFAADAGTEGEEAPDDSPQAA
jgi:hypothetical protein